MKPSQTYFLFLATAATAVARRSITRSASISEATSIPVHAPHTADHAPVVNPGPVTDVADDISEVCIQFSSQNDNWYFSNQNPWGSNSDTFGSLGGQMCVPTSNSAGGAMFIGPDPNPGPGNTKLECFFPTSGIANCDISLVDGYSLSVTCVAGQAVVGGNVDLWTTGNSCPDTSAQGSGICKNGQGYAAEQSDVSPFFQEAIENGNQYCVWVNCAQDFFFDVTETLYCSISGTDAS